MTSRAMLALVAIGLLVVAVRLPLVLRQPGGQDEDYYAVPGATILKDGIPRIPYVPARNADSVFYHADIALYALPPAYFYWQAGVYLALGPGYGQARVASLLAGLIAIGLVFELGRAWTGEPLVGLLAAGLYSVSRVFFFPATFARPDMLCAACCLAAILAMTKWHSADRESAASRKWLPIAGAFAGLAMLTHPFALVVCLQLAGWIVVVERGPSAIRPLATLYGCALAVFALWIPLIALHPDIFWFQFRNNVLAPGSQSLLPRIVFPISSFAVQWKLLLEHAGATQLALVISGLVAATLVAVKSRARNDRLCVTLAWSSIYLLVVCQGTHPAKGYWCYPGALAFLCTARACLACPKFLRISLALVALLLLVPGSGARAWLAHVKHWNDDAYNARRFVGQLLADSPTQGKYLVDVAFVFDYWLAGRTTVLALDIPKYFAAGNVDDDYLIVSRTGLEQDLPRRLGAEYVRSYGTKDDPIACYAELHRRGKRAE